MSGSENGALLSVRGLKKHYPVRGGVFGGTRAVVRAVDGVSFDLKEGETFGLVGESGCGKSTLGRAVLRLEPPTEGSVLLDGKDLVSCSSAELFRLRRELQMIFQDPYSSLNPRMTVGEIVREPLVVHKLGSRDEQIQKVEELLARVGISRDATDRYPHEFSGGQRQRIGIARALTLGPRLIVADEPVSALDVSVQAQVLNLMVELQKEFGLTYLFISHDLGVVEYISDTMAIMYLGRIVESGARDTIFRNPAHPYTRALLASVPDPDPRKRRDFVAIQGEIPSPVNPPSGCPFHPRCPYAVPDCSKVVPELEAMGPVAAGGRRHLVSCIRKHEIAGE